jgi:hypothetical protein
MQRCTSPPKMGPWFHSLLWKLHKPWSSGKEDQENCQEAPLCERVHMWTLGMPCLVFFLGDASLTMTPCNVFSIYFDFFWIPQALLRDLGQTRGGIDVCQVGWEPWFGLGSRVPHPQGTSLYFSPIFLVCISCSPSAKLDLNGFRAKIIYYMAEGRDNSQPPGCGTPGRSPSHEN